MQLCPEIGKSEMPVLQKLLLNFQNDPNILLHGCFQPLVRGFAINTGRLGQGKTHHWLIVLTVDLRNYFVVVKATSADFVDELDFRFGQVADRGIDWDLCLITLDYWTGFALEGAEDLVKHFKIERFLIFEF